MLWGVVLCVLIKIVVLMRLSVRNRWCGGNLVIGVVSMEEDKIVWYVEVIIKSVCIF